MILIKTGGSKIKKEHLEFEIASGGKTVLFEEIPPYYCDRKGRKMGKSVYLLKWIKKQYAELYFPGCAQCHREAKLGLVTHGVGDRNPKCCCNRCWKHAGYLKDDILLAPLSVYRNAWSKRNGFWSSQGCRLPAELRSIICLRFTCHEYDLKYEEEWIEAFRLELDTLNTIYHEIYYGIQRTLGREKE